MSSINQNIIGLSGHIDHGKTSIVKALTGTNTDNLKEESKRGMTINIGFAFLNESITMIDVPGHEKFIKNMVTGVNAIDYALLVVAADDGIMPQTIEHFEILKLFNVVDGSIIINKIDLVDEEWLDLVEKDILELVKGSFLENKLIHKVSTTDNIGLVELKKYLVDYSYNIHRIDSNVFRFFIDRVFISKGFGSIVTGTVLSGTAKVGDKLKILPQNKEVKIRGIETHKKTVDELKIGDRGAINIQSINKILVKKGNHLSETNFYSTYESAIVSIKLLNRFKKTIKNNERLRIYCGTQEFMGRIQLLDTKELKPNEEAGGLFKFEKPVILSIGDKFIIRKYSPLITIGGGEILDFSIYRKWKDNKKYIDKIYSAKDKYERLCLIIGSRGINPFNYETFGNYLNISDDLLKSTINEMINIIIVNNEWILTKKQFDNIIDVIINYFEVFHQKNPYKSGMIKDEIVNFLKINDNFLDDILDHLVQKKQIKYNDNNWSQYNFCIKISDDEKKNMQDIYELVHQKKFQAISINELISEINKSETFIKRLLDIQVSSKKIIILDGSLIISKQNIDILVDSIRDFFMDNDSLDIKKFKELINVSRKFAVPLLEYLDKINITYRIGNERKFKE